MAVKDTQKFLKSMNAFVEKEYKRGALDKFPTIVTFTAKACAQGFKEGYLDLLKKSPVVSNFLELSNLLLLLQA